MQKDKSVFKLEELPIQRFAESLGLPGAPKIKFLNKEIAKRKKNASHTAANADPKVASSKAEASDEADSSDESGTASDESHDSSDDEEAAPEAKVEASSKADKVSPQRRFRG